MTRNSASLLAGSVIVGLLLLIGIAWGVSCRKIEHPQTVAPEDTLPVTRPRKPPTIPHEYRSLVGTWRMDKTYPKTGTATEGRVTYNADGTFHFDLTVTTADNGVGRVRLGGTWRFVKELLVIRVEVDESSHENAKEKAVTGSGWFVGEVSRKRIMLLTENKLVTRNVDTGDLESVQR